MTGNKAHSIAHIKLADIQEISMYVSKLADASSEIIYVYSYSKSKEKELDQLVSSGKKRLVAFTPLRKTPSLNKAKRSSTSNSYKNKIWAIRIEGQADPINRNFTTKKTAIAYAKTLLRKGVGKVIEVVN
ncbi:MAG: hypothetical protein ACI8P3_003518 [Saprospiraceae bacterium]|jgi:hypothetical protein